MCMFKLKCLCFMLIGDEGMPTVTVAGGTTTQETGTDFTGKLHCPLTGWDLAGVWSPFVLFSGGLGPLYSCTVASYALYICSLISHVLIPWYLLPVDSGLLQLAAQSSMHNHPILILAMFSSRHSNNRLHACAYSPEVDCPKTRVSPPFPCLVASHGSGGHGLYQVAAPATRWYWSLTTDPSPYT